MDSLERAAQAMDCKLVYGFVPRRALEELIEERAKRRAREVLASTAHSMALEDQSPSEDSEEVQLAQLVRELAEKSGPALWEDE